MLKMRGYQKSSSQPKSSLGQIFEASTEKEERNYKKLKNSFD